MTTPPLAFSVVIPTRGSRPSLRDAVGSVLQQSYPHFMIVVVCDGESAGAEGLLADVADPRVRLVSQDHRGVSSARNLGLSHSTDPWVTFLDDDDLARPEWLDTWASAITEDTLAVTAGVRYCSSLDNGHDRWCRLSTSDPSMGASTILAGGFAVRRDVLLSVGGYDEGLRASENQDLGLRLCDHIASGGAAGRIRLVDQVVVDVLVEPARGREVRYGSARSDAAKVFMKRYPHRLAADPVAQASLLRIIAAWDRSTGSHEYARRAARRACVLEPSNVENWRSLLLAAFPRTANVSRRIFRSRLGTGQ